MVDRIERHDVVNAVLLAGVLLLFALAILTAADSLASTADEGFIESTKEPEVDEPPIDDGSSTTTAEDSTTTLVDARPAAEVTVRVANGARREGVAGAGTEAVKAAGYPTLAPKNGPTLDDSVVYYVNGYAADAAKVAEVLGLEPTQISPMPADPGVDIDGAHLIAVLGVNSDF